MHDPANKDKDRFKVQDRPMDFSVTKVYCGRKFIDLVSESALELTSVKLPVVKSNVVLEKHIHNYLK